MRRTAVAALRYRKVLRFTSRSPCDMERAGYRTSRRPDIGLMRWRGSLLCLGLATVAQPCGYPIDGQMDCLHHALVGLAGAMTLQQFDLYMVERIEVGEAVLDRARQQGILLEQCL